MSEVAVAQERAPLAREMNSVLRAMAASAARAPSGDNLQPWSFSICPRTNSLEVWLEESADSTPLNSGQGMSLIACGAAIECAICAANDHGWSVRTEFPHDTIHDGSRRCVARIVLNEHTGGAAGRLTQLIEERTTNRRLYDGAQLSPDLLQKLHSATAPIYGVRTHWITRREEITILARLLSRADAMLFGEASMRRAFLNNVRFNVRPDAPAERGLPAAVLGISAPEQLTLRMLKAAPDWIFRCSPGPALFASYAGRLVKSSSGLCIVTADGEAQAELRSGRRMLRAWLALTDAGLAAQPMMAAIALLFAQEYGSAAIVRALGAEKLRSFNSEFRAALSGWGVEGNPMFILRFGHAAAPAARTGRLPLEQLLRGPGNSA